MKRMRFCPLVAGLTTVVVTTAMAELELQLPAGNRYVHNDAVKRVYEADAAVDAAWTSCATPEALKARQDEVRQSLIESLGGFPRRNPLNSQVTGRIQRDGYSIEKVMFESRAGHHVTANVFVPDSVKFPGKRPGIVVPCGHSMNGKASSYYQRGALKAAQRGMIAMVYDPIDQGERRQSRKDAKLWSCAAHNNIGRRAELLGWSTASFRIWDGMRALDYLESRSDVDAAHLGVMGHSGGGTMTSWIMCLDDRIKCAAPSGYLTTIRALCSECGPQDAEQFAYGELKFGFNHLGHVVLRAPSPVLLCSSHDDFFPFVGVLETAANASRVYGTLGAADAFRLSDTLGEHAWHESTSTYAADWMNCHLHGVKLDKTMSDYRELQYGFSFSAVDTGLAYSAKNLADMRTNRWEVSVTPTGCTLDLEGERTVYDMMADEAECQRAARPPLSVERLCMVAGIRPAKEVGFKVRGAVTRNGVEYAVLVMDDGTPVPVRTFGKGKRALYLSDALKLSDAEKEAQAIAAEGYRVTVADLRGFGETACGKHRFYGVGDGDEEIARLYALLGVSLTAKRTEDALSVVAYIGGHERIRLVAEGRAGIAAAHAAYILKGARFASLELREPPASWSELFADDSIAFRFADTVYGAWKAYDWADLAKEWR